MPSGGPMGGRPSPLQFPPSTSTSASTSTNDLFIGGSGAGVGTKPTSPGPLGFRFPASGPRDRPGTGASRKDSNPSSLYGLQTPSPATTQFPRTNPNSNNMLSVNMNAGKRASQLIHHSSFLNQYDSSATSHAHGNIVYHNVGREKAWNPRKAVVQGTKLLLYKPPKDRAAEIRELFASEMLPEHFHEREKEREGEQELSPIMDREEEEVSGSGGAADGKTLAARIAAYREGGAGNGSDERSPRPERIFRGHTRHPKLVVDANEHVQSGSMHALLHEVVFATTFLVASNQSPSELPPPALNIPAQHDADLTEGSLSSLVSASKQPPAESPPSSHDGVSQTPTGPAASNPDGPDQATTADHSRYRLGAWKSFAQAAITVLPSSRFLGREQFESELLGHCENMTSTSDTEEGNAEDSGEDGLKRFASERVRWINDTYREFWGGFGNDRVSGWQAVLRKLGPVSESDSTAPVANSSSEPSSESSDRFISPSSSTSLSPSSSDPGQTVPLLSPFPSTSAPHSASTHPFPFPSSSPKSAKQRWNSLADLLDREGFLPGLLASNRVGVERAASSLASWTHYQLLTLLWELKVENRSVTRALLERVVFLNANEETGHWKLFYGDEKEMHWLTRLVLQHVLTPSAPSSSSTSSNAQEPQRSSTSQSTQPVSSRSRGRIITSWVEVAEACRASGDESSFQAIRAALTSRPVVRLEKAWREVAANIKNIVDNWAMARMRSYPQAQVSGRGLEALKEAETSDASPIPPAPPLSRSPSSGGGGFLLTPWIAPELETIGSLIGQSETSGGGIIEVDNLLSIHSALDKIVERFRLCANADDDAERNLIPLWKQWETLSCKSSKDSPSFSSCCEISFSVEPRTRAHFVEHFGVPSTSTIPPLAPFDFPRPFRELSLIPRFALSSSATSEAQFTISESRMQDILSLGTPSPVTRRSGRLGAMAHAGPPVANPRRMQTLGLPGTTNIGEEFGESMVTTFDGEVVLKVLRAAPSPRVSRALSKARGDTSERTSRDRRGGDTSNRSSRLDAGDGFGIREDVSDNSSHTLSRAPSISVAMPGTLNRKTSHTSLLSRRSSLPSLKRGPSLIHPEPKTATTLVAAVHAASTDRLINILIDGLEVTASTADDSGFGFGGAWSISVDREDFRRTWWASFRSFVRVLAFFELLTKGPRGLGIANDSEESPATQRRIRVLDVMRDWLVNGGGAQDLVDFLDLAEAWNTYLDDLIRHSSVPHVKSSAQDLRRATTIHILSPIRMFGGMASEESSAPDAAAPNIDAISAAEIVDSFNGIAKAVMSILPSKDIMIAADILEVQLSDRGFYAPKEPVPHQEDVLSETIHSLLCRVSPSPLVTKFHGKNQFHRSLPSSLRLILQAHQAIRIWVTSKIASPAINQQTREDRILKAIRAVEICRLRSASSRKSDPFSILVPSAPSFVETAIIAALWSPESRVYRSAWACVASTLQVSTETLQALLSGPGSSMELPIDSKECTVDGGWLFEQILGVLSLPDNIERSDLPLVNFDKRRYIVQLAETFGHQTAFMNSTYENDVARMNNLLTDAGHFNRLGKAAREAAEVEDNLFSKRGPSGRRPPYPFKPLAAAEVEKLRRDYSFREKLDREREIEHQKASQREQNLDRAMQLQRAPTTKHQRGKRSVAGGVTLFLRSAVVRPASAAWGSARPPTKLRSAAELDFEPSGKPSDKLSLHSARVTPYASDERPYLFQLTTEDGGHWLFQASSLFEQTAWMKAIEAAAQKGASMDFDSTGPADILVKSSRKAGGVFGVPLETLIERENPNANDLSDKIPRALEHMLLAIERRDLSETGLYRMSGSKAQVLAIQQAFDDGGMPNLDEDGQFTDIHALTGAVKAYCRDLPEPLIPYEFFKQLITILRASYCPKPYRQAIDPITFAIPSSSYATLRRLVQHFDTCVPTELRQRYPQTADIRNCIVSRNYIL
ncbi:hypothetical protein DL93DRAFT_1393528 [Clavulina sp. PMI_390]|nr:hypothetical protein DL93DRAFT_1393528 [Clavulina sp. PMI_390]